MPRKTRTRLKNATEYIKAHAEVPMSPMDKGQIAYLTTTDIDEARCLPSASVCCEILEKEFPETLIQICTLAIDLNRTEGAIRSNGYLSAKQVVEALHGDGTEYLATFHMPKSITQANRLARWVLRQFLSQRRDIESDARFQASELRENGRHYGAIS